MKSVPFHERPICSYIPHLTSSCGRTHPSIALWPSVRVSGTHYKSRTHISTSVVSRPFHWTKWAYNKTTGRSALLHLFKTYLYVGVIAARSILSCIGAAHWIWTNTLSILSALPLPLEYCGIWCCAWDSNPPCSDFKSVVSCLWTTTTFILHYIL